MDPISLDQPRQAWLNRLSREVSSCLEVDTLLPWLLTEVLDGFGGQSGAVLVVNADGQLRHSAWVADGQSQPGSAELLADWLEHGLPGWVVQNLEPASIPNTAADSRWSDADERLLPGAGSVLAVPLLGREGVVGALIVGREAAHAFSPDDLILLMAVGYQAGIAVENALLFAAERRERDISIILREVAHTINGSLKLDQVLPLVLEQLGRVIAYDSASILLRHGDRLRISAARGFSDPAAVLRLDFDAEQGISARVVRERRSLVVPDVQRSAEWLPADLPETQAIRAWIGAPLIAKDEVLGLLSVDSHRVGAYTEADGQVVAAFAEQAAVAVLNARLFAQSERRAYSLRALADTAQAINATRDLSEVLRLVVKHAQEGLGMAAASLALIDGDHLVFKEAVGPANETVRGLSLELGAGIAGWVAQHNEPIIVPDVRKDSRFFGGVDEVTGFVTQALGCVPVRIQGRAIGVLEVINPASGQFDPDTLGLLDSLASLAGTAIVQAQHVAELQAAEQRFAGLFEGSIDPILISDLDGIISDANRRACEFFGYSRAELLGMRVTRLHRVRTDNLTRGRFTPLLKGLPISYQTRIQTLAGAEVPVDVHAKLIEHGGQKFIQWVQHDLSERLALEDLRNDLMSMIIHDLRSPLGNIISSLDILRSSLGSGDEMVHSLLSIAMRAATRLSRLVDSLLDLRRLESGEMVLNRVPADLPDLLAEAVEQVQPTATVKGVNLATSVGAELPALTLDVDLIRRVLVNLLDNAVKYTPAGGAVTLSAAPNGDHLLVSVRDTGPGVPESDQQRIFEKFVRVQRESTSKGLGLGLAFCKLAVEAHGGRIWVDSPAGRGATFYFSLPIVEGDRKRPAKPVVP